MHPIDMIARTTLAFLGLLAVTALYRAVAGRVRWLGLLAGRPPGEAADRRLRPARLQLLAVIALAALSYPGAAAVRPSGLGLGLALLFLASNLIYLWDEYRGLRPADPA